MKNLLLLILFAFSFINSNAQKFKTTSVSNIIVNNIDKTQSDLKELFNQYEITPQLLEINNSRIKLELQVSNVIYEPIYKELLSWGYVSSNNVSQNNLEQEISELTDEVSYLKTEIERYNTLIKGSENSTSEKILNYSERIIFIEKQIHELQTSIKKYEKASNLSFVKIDFREETNTTMEYSSSWVNMPGIEYSLLLTEQPVNGVHPDMMHGISLKYLFNTGKSYGVLGLYKNYDEPSSIINECYIFAYGQDFYSKRMGRGQRKFFNLYTSINAGVYILSGVSDRSASWFINPFLGLEIFKNKYFLIDNKVGYFLPYRDNRNMRGLLYNFSFNFVF